MILAPALQALVKAVRAARAVVLTAALTLAADLTPAVAVATQLQAAALQQLMHALAIHTSGAELLLLPALTVVA